MFDEKKLRLFAGFPLPPRAEDRLSALRLRLAAPGDGLRWSTPDQWHITLRFFGEVEPTQLARLVEALHRFTGEQPTLRMENLGLFPAKGILYAALEPTDELTAFHTAFSGHMRLMCPMEAGAEVSTSTSLPFHPHITLARSKGRTGQKTLKALATPTLPALGPELRWKADKIHLFESLSGSGGAGYNIVATHLLP